LMDAYIFIKKDSTYLELAKKVIECRLKDRWKNGLIPNSLNNTMTHLDSLVDFAVSLRRYAEVSKEKEYFEVSDEIMEQTLKIHRGKKGYYTHVSRQGNPIMLRVNTIAPKYNGLLLKGIINMLTLKERIYGNALLHDLFKDR
ncbi:MAG: hypothetical protein ACFFBD_20490, partial [Candidatus Hodarchaeota archaeon]